jgi:hypothetical protein
MTHCVKLIYFNTLRIISTHTVLNHMEFFFIQESIAMATGGPPSMTSSSKHEALTCALCLEIYTEPKLLPCFHTFCRRCLNDLISKTAATVTTETDSQASGPKENNSPNSLKEEDPVSNNETADTAETAESKAVDSKKSVGLSSLLQAESSDKIADADEVKESKAFDNTNPMPASCSPHAESSDDTTSPEAEPESKPMTDSEEYTTVSPLQAESSDKTAAPEVEKESKEADNTEPIAVASSPQLEHESKPMTDSEELVVESPLQAMSSDETAAPDAENESKEHIAASSPQAESSYTDTKAIDDATTAEPERDNKEYDSKEPNEVSSSLQTDQQHPQTNSERKVEPDNQDAQKGQAVPDGSAASSQNRETEQSDNVRSLQLTFHCPTCRMAIPVPERGAFAFQTNVYIRDEELQRAREETQGLQHTCVTFDLFCVKCDELICVSCKMGSHLHHESLTLTDAAAAAKTTIENESGRIEPARQTLQKNIDERELDLEHMEEKRALIEKEIRQRHARIVTAADKYRDGALQMLSDTFINLDSHRAACLTTVISNTSRITGLQERVANTEHANDMCDLVLVAKELRSGSGSQKAVDDLSSYPTLDKVKRPVLRSCVEADGVGKMFSTMETFIGTPEFVEIAAAEHEALVEQVHCEDVAPNAEVFSICLNKSENRARLSFVPSFECQGPIEIILSTGTTTRQPNKHQGKKSFVCLTS